MAVRAPVRRPAPARRPVPARRPGPLPRPRRPGRTPRPGPRLLALLTGLLCAAAVVAWRLVLVQGLASERFVSLAAEQRERRIVLPPQRGSILDRDGSVLALSLDMRTIFANPRFVHDPKGAAAALSPLLGAEQASLEAKLASDRGFVYLARKVDPAVAEKVAALRIPGVDSLTEPRRFYPAGSLGAHLVGFVGTDNEGLAGMEGIHDRLLAGKPGEMLMERDPDGYSIPAGKSRVTPPVPGGDLVLTVDREIQFAAEDALARAVERYRAKGGTIVVMRPGTGEVLAMANAPAFDPNQISSSTPEARRNRAVIEVFEPGSANKVITVAAALESRVAAPDDAFSVPDRISMAGRVFHDAYPHPTKDLTLTEVLAQSSNVGTIKVATAVGKERLHEHLERFGYGRPTGLGIPGESGGLLPDPERWWKTSLPTIAIGQGVAVTPMQIVGVYATVANGGVRAAPSLVRGTSSGGRLRPAERAGSERVIREETAARLTRMLVQVVDGDHGTGSLAAVPGYRVAGKTGTAQKPRTDGRGYEGYVASFVGFAPAGDPKLVAGVILDDPDPIWGGVTAAPTFREVMEFGLRHLGIGPGPALPQEGTPLPAPGRSGGVAPDPSRRPVSPDTPD